jgi:hypothetical protein
MADSQVPWGVDALGGSITEAAWRSKPSWYLVATEDRIIPPPAQRGIAQVVEARNTGVIDEDIQPLDALRSCLNICRAGHVGRLATALGEREHDVAAVALGPDHGGVRSAIRFER